MIYEYSGNYFKVVGPKDSPNMGMIVQMIRNGKGPNGEHMVLCRRPFSEPVTIYTTTKQPGGGMVSRVCALFHPRNLVSATRQEIETALKHYNSGDDYQAA